jgi:membrane-bound inhibitor of C-type lysozyme
VILSHPPRQGNDGTGRFAGFGLVYTRLSQGANMKRRKTRLVFGAALLAAGVAAGSSPACAQTFQSYRCADRTQFIVGFFDYDKRAHLQIDGHAATLSRRFALSGSRYSGSGVTLKFTKAGVTLRHVGRPVTTCEAV